MTAPTVSPEISGGQAYGMDVSALQTGVQISGSKITGKLNYVKNFLQFSDDPTEQEGTFLALQVEAPEGVDRYHELIGAKVTQGERKFEAGDKLLVCRITDKTTQKIKLTAKRGSESKSTTYDLSGLELGVDE